ncbi:MAG: anaerobic ribonucleoside-triphosphate reductase activating protein [bacterium]|nr:anaerobic ribonucleoside-triphosphate reductase activating protein [bacterium]
MKIRLASNLQKGSIVDGVGLRAVIWTQGCPHNCYMCHNPETHSFDGGFIYDTEDLKMQIKTLESEEGITFSGGDPMMQAEACYDIAKYAHNCGLNVWCYTGFTFEELLKMSKTNNSILDFLNEIDVLIDGKFILEQKSLNIKFRGSRNQRILDVKESLKNNKPILIEELMKEDDNKVIKEIEEKIFI